MLSPRYYPVLSRKTLIFKCFSLFWDRVRKKTQKMKTDLCWQLRCLCSYISQTLGGLPCKCLETVFKNNLAQNLWQFVQGKSFFGHFSSNFFCIYIYFFIFLFWAIFMHCKIPKKKTAQNSKPTNSNLLYKFTFSIFKNTVRHFGIWYSFGCQCHSHISPKYHQRLLQLLTHILKKQHGSSSLIEAQQHQYKTFPKHSKAFENFAKFFSKPRNTFTLLHHRTHSVMNFVFLLSWIIIHPLFRDNRFATISISDWLLLFRVEDAAVQKPKRIFGLEHEE